MTWLAAIHHDRSFSHQHVDTGRIRILFVQKALVDARDGLFDRQVTGDHLQICNDGRRDETRCITQLEERERRTVVLMCCEGEGLIGGRSDVKDGRAETRTKGRLAGAIVPLDEHTFVSAGEQHRPVGREVKGEDGQRMPVQMRRFQLLIDVQPMEVEEEKNATRLGAESEGLLEWMDLPADDLLVEGQVRLADRLTSHLFLLHVDQIDLRALLADEQTETPLKSTRENTRHSETNRGRRDEHSC